MPSSPNAAIELQSLPRNRPTPAWRDLLAILLLAALILGASCLTRDYWVYNEGRRGLVALEMIRSGDWLTPRLVGQPLLTKPPLFYWGEAVAFKIFGVSDRASRFPSLAGALLMIAGVWLTSARLFGRKAAAIGAVVAACLPISAWMAQSAEPEMLFAGTATAAMACWASRNFAGCRHWGWRLGFWGMLSLSAFSKGPLEPLSVLLAVGAWQWAMRRRPVESWGWAVLGWAILLAPMAAWFAALAAHGAGLGAIWRELQSHVGEEAPHAKPFGYFLGEMGHLMFPWGHVALVALAAGLGRLAWRERGKTPRAARDWLAAGRGERLLIALWAFFTFLLYSAVVSKRYYYGLAFVPPAGGACALLWNELTERRWPGLERKFSGRSKSFAIIAAVGGAILLASLFMGFPEEIKPYSGDGQLNHNMVVGSVGVLALAIGFSGWLRFRNGADGDGGRFWGGVLIGLAGISAALTLLGAAILNPMVNQQQSLKRATDELAPLVAGRADIASLNDTHTILFYLGLTHIRIIGPDEMSLIASQHTGTRVILYGDNWDENIPDHSPWRILYESKFILKKGARVLVVEAK